MINLNHFINKIENAKSLDFGDIFNQSIELFKKVWLQGLVVYLLNMVLMLPFILIMYVPMIVLGVLGQESFDGGLGLEGMGILAISAMIVLIMVMILGVTTISVALKGAYYRMLKHKDLGLDASDDYFFFLKSKYLKKTFMLSLSIIGMMILGYALCVLPVFYLMVPLYYMVITYAMNPDLSNSDIIKIGFKLGNKKWFLSFGLIIVAGILAGLVGVLMCFIGIYVTQQFSDIPAYYVYKSVVGLKEQDAIDEIGTPIE
ncbi:hypothetical protein KFZ70_08160 [Tamlana fucoidanivorans]|uniref:DUF975 family protein n=1 Tax=Allotamlana fucoidanivorans TaxID=2583814 RepID=A0A5C4SKF0_9FLAO|nr:hypothetical protein [Tamlana fucoidanivorans]TNJ43705.1 hypothetical protein FGF67_10045 [Tamlana fucoidanivorans]